MGNASGTMYDEGGGGVGGGGGGGLGSNAGGSNVQVFVQMRSPSSEDAAIPVTTTTSSNKLQDNNRRDSTNRLSSSLSSLSFFSNTNNNNSNNNSSNNQAFAIQKDQKTICWTAKNATTSGSSGSFTSNFHPDDKNKDGGATANDNTVFTTSTSTTTDWKGTFDGAFDASSSSSSSTGGSSLPNHPTALWIETITQGLAPQLVLEGRHCVVAAYGAAQTGKTSLLFRGPNNNNNNNNNHQKNNNTNGSEDEMFDHDNDDHHVNDDDDDDREGEMGLAIDNDDDDDDDDDDDEDEDDDKDDDVDKAEDEEEVDENENDKDAHRIRASNSKKQKRHPGHGDNTTSNGGGLTLQLMEQIFSCLQQCAHETAYITLRVSAVELYLEQMTDLLLPGPLANPEAPPLSSYSSSSSSSSSVHSSSSSLSSKASAFLPAEETQPHSKMATTATTTTSTAAAAAATTTFPTAPVPTKQQRRIHVDSETGLIQGCSQLSCVSLSDVMAVIQRALAHRTASYTNLAQDSHRSSVILQLQLERYALPSSITTTTTTTAAKPAAGTAPAAVPTSAPSSPHRWTLSSWGAATEAAATATPTATTTQTQTQTASLADSGRLIRSTLQIMDLASSSVIVMDDPNNTRSSDDSKTTRIPNTSPPVANPDQQSKAETNQSTSDDTSRGTTNTTKASPEENKVEKSPLENVVTLPRQQQKPILTQLLEGPLLFRCRRRRHHHPEALATTTTRFILTMDPSMNASTIKTTLSVLEFGLQCRNLAANQAAAAQRSTPNPKLKKGCHVDETKEETADDDSSIESGQDEDHVNHNNNNHDDNPIVAVENRWKTLVLALALECLRIQKDSKVGITRRQALWDIIYKIDQIHKQQQQQQQQQQKQLKHASSSDEDEDKDDRSASSSSSSSSNGIDEPLQNLALVERNSTISHPELELEAQKVQFQNKLQTLEQQWQQELQAKEEWQKQHEIFMTHSNDLAEELLRRQGELQECKDQVRQWQERHADLQQLLWTCQFRESEAVVFLRHYQRFCTGVLRHTKLATAGSSSSGEDNRVSDILAQVPGATLGMEDLFDLDRAMVESGLLEKEELDQYKATNVRPTVDKEESKLDTSDDDDDDDDDDDHHQDTDSVADTSTSSKGSGGNEYLPSPMALKQSTEQAKKAVDAQHHHQQQRQEQEQQDDSSTAMTDTPPTPNEEPQIIAPLLSWSRFSQALSSSASTATTLTTATTTSPSSFLSRGETIEMTEARQKAYQTPSGKYIHLRETALEKAVVSLSEKCVQLHTELVSVKAKLEAATATATTTKVSSTVGSNESVKKPLTFRGFISFSTTSSSSDGAKEGEETAEKDDTGKGKDELQTADKTAAEQLKAERDSLAQELEKTQKLVLKMNDMHVANKVLQKKIEDRDNLVGSLESKLAALQEQYKQSLKEHEASRNEFKNKITSLERRLENQTTPLWQLTPAGIDASAYDQWFLDGAKDYVPRHGYPKHVEDLLPPLRSRLIVPFTLNADKTWVDGKKTDLNSPAEKGGRKVERRQSIGAPEPPVESWIQLLKKANLGPGKSGRRQRKVVVDTYVQTELNGEDLGFESGKSMNALETRQKKITVETFTQTELMGEDLGSESGNPINGMEARQQKMAVDTYTQTEPMGDNLDSEPGKIDLGARLRKVTVETYTQTELHDEDIDSEARKRINNGLETRQKKVTVETYAQTELKGEDLDSESGTQINNGLKARQRKVTVDTYVQTELNGEDLDSESEKSKKNDLEARQKVTVDAYAQTEPKDEDLGSESGKAKKNDLEARQKVTVDAYAQTEPKDEDLGSESGKAKNNDLEARQKVTVDAYAQTEPKDEDLGSESGKPMSALEARQRKVTVDTFVQTELKGEDLGSESGIAISNGLEARLKKVSMDMNTQTELKGKDLDSESGIAISNGLEARLKKVSMDMNTQTELKGKDLDSESRTPIKAWTTRQKKIAVDTYTQTELMGEDIGSESGKSINGMAARPQKIAVDMYTQTEPVGEDLGSESGKPIDCMEARQEKVTVDMNTQTELKGKDLDSESRTPIKAWKTRQKKIVVDTYTQTELMGEDIGSESGKSINGMAARPRKIAVDMYTQTEPMSEDLGSESGKPIDCMEARQEKVTVDTYVQTELKGEDLSSESGNRIYGIEARQRNKSDTCVQTKIMGEDLDSESIVKITKQSLDPPSKDELDVKKSKQTLGSAVPPPLVRRGSNLSPVSHLSSPPQSPSQQKPKPKVAPWVKHTELPTATAPITSLKSSPMPSNVNKQKQEVSKRKDLNMNQVSMPQPPAQVIPESNMSIVSTLSSPPQSPQHQQSKLIVAPWARPFESSLAATPATATTSFVKNANEKDQENKEYELAKWKRASISVPDTQVSREAKLPIGPSLSSLSPSDERLGPDPKVAPWTTSVLPLDTAPAPALQSAATTPFGKNNDKGTTVEAPFCSLAPPLHSATNLASNNDSKDALKATDPNAPFLQRLTQSSHQRSFVRGGAAKHTPSASARDSSALSNHSEPSSDNHDNKTGQGRLLPGINSLIFTSNEQKAQHRRSSSCGGGGDAHDNVSVLTEDDFQESKNVFEKAATSESYPKPSQTRRNSLSHTAATSSSDDDKKKLQSSLQNQGTPKSPSNFPKKPECFNITAKKDTPGLSQGGEQKLSTAPVERSWNKFANNGPSTTTVDPTKSAAPCDEARAHSMSPRSRPWRKSVCNSVGQAATDTKAKADEEPGLSMAPATLPWNKMVHNGPSATANESTTKTPPPDDARADSVPPGTQSRSKKVHNVPATATAEANANSAPRSAAEAGETEEPENELKKKFEAIGSRNMGEEVIESAGNAEAKDYTRTTFGESLKRQTVPETTKAIPTIASGEVITSTFGIRSSKQRRSTNVPDDASVASFDSNKSGARKPFQAPSMTRSSSLTRSQVQVTGTASGTIGSSGSNRLTGGAKGSSSVKPVVEQETLGDDMKEKSTPAESSSSDQMHSKSTNDELKQKFQTIGSRNTDAKVIEASGVGEAREYTRTNFGESLKHNAEAPEKSVPTLASGEVITSSFGKSRKTATSGTNTTTTSAPKPGTKSSSSKPSSYEPQSSSNQQSNHSSRNTAAMHSQVDEKQQDNVEESFDPAYLKSKFAAKAENSKPLLPQTPIHSQSRKPRELARNQASIEHRTTSEPDLARDKTAARAGEVLAKQRSATEDMLFPATKAPAQETVAFKTSSRSLPAMSRTNSGLKANRSLAAPAQTRKAAESKNTEVSIKKRQAQLPRVDVVQELPRSEPKESLSQTVEPTGEERKSARSTNDQKPSFQIVNGRLLKNDEDLCKVKKAKKKKANKKPA